MANITRNALRDIHGFSEKEVLDLDQKLLNILGETIMLISAALLG
jgi:hypothetical protein